MEVPIVDLKRHYQGMRAEIDAAVRRVLVSGRYIGGPETEAFEREFAAYCQAEHAVGVGSGTAALNLTLRALGVVAGDEVLTTAFTLSATLDAITELGASPVLVDADPGTCTLDPAALEVAITSRTRAILPVHIYGHPADMDPIEAIARRHGLPVVCDACEAHGSLYREKNVGGLGAASCFSFYPTKNLGGLSDGGAVVTNDRELADRVRLLRQHGWDRRYHSVESSMNSRISEINAAVLREKLRRLDEWNGRRRAIARTYDSALLRCSIRRAPSARWAFSGYYLYVLRTSRRAQLASYLASRGVSTDVHWPEPPHLLPAFRRLGYREGSFPVAESLCREVLSIPIFPEMTEVEARYVRNAIADAALRLEDTDHPLARARAS